MYYINQINKEDIFTYITNTLGYKYFMLPNNIKYSVENVNNETVPCYIVHLTVKENNQLTDRKVMLGITDFEITQTADNEKDKLTSKQVKTLQFILFISKYPNYLADHKTYQLQRLEEFVSSQTNLSNKDRRQLTNIRRKKAKLIDEYFDQVLPSRNGKNQDITD